MIIKLANVLRSLKASALADGIIAAKRGTQGRSPVLLSPFVNHVNKTVRESAVLRNSGLFKGNRLNVKRLKTDLQVLNGLESSVAGAQVALPVGAYANSYHNALRDGYDNSEAHARGRRAGALGLLGSLGLQMPKKALTKTTAFHKLLSKDSNYGYDLLERASAKAETAMNRPKAFNYSELAYRGEPK